MKYSIYEGNIEKLEKKLKTIGKKCAKYGVNFKYEKLGERFHNVRTEDGDIITVKFIEIEVEGFLKHENWEFIATIDHYDVGNIIRQFNTEIEVPMRYCHTDAICEHCNTKRRRKSTYLIHNTETDEWKQVGKTCLKEFTGGIDAEAAACVEQWFKKLGEGQEGCFAGVSYEKRYPIKDILCYAKEVVDRFGYVSPYDENVQYQDTKSTREATMDFYIALEEGGMFCQHIIEEAEKIGFDGNRECHRKYVDQAIEWIRSNEEESGYMFNLRIACSEDYILWRDIGLVVSLLPTYYRHLKNLEYQEKQKVKIALEKQSSDYQGEKGQRLVITPASIECIHSIDGIYGMMYLYKIIDTTGNIYMWSTGKLLELDNVKTIIGTVKNHQEYRGVKQTHLTRCKVS